VECEERIRDLLGNRSEVEFQLKTLCKKLSNLKPVEAEAQHFAEVIRSTAILAEDVSAKVRVLDKAKVTKLLINLRISANGKGSHSCQFSQLNRILWTWVYTQFTLQNNLSRC
jgi:hypothetical protein